MRFFAPCGNASDGLMSCKKSFRHRARGQALVEFALMTIFLVTLVVGILEISLFLYNYSVLTDAAKEGVRCGIVHCSRGVTGTVNYVLSNASVHNTSGTTVTVSYPDDGNAPGDRVQVTVSYPYNPLFLVDWATTTVSSTSVGRIQF